MMSKFPKEGEGGRRKGRGLVAQGPELSGARGSFGGARRDGCVGTGSLWELPVACLHAGVKSHGPLTSQSWCEVRLKSCVFATRQSCPLQGQHKNKLKGGLIPHLSRPHGSIKRERFFYLLTWNTNKILKSIFVQSLQARKEGRIGARTSCLETRPGDGQAKCRQRP